jgi:CDP-diacylglycerol--glycerol-3-phosphate 3-phosphatidyltransferase
VRTADERAGALLAGLTYLRIALTPAVMALVLLDRPWTAVPAATLFAAAALTDFLDGRLARRWARTSALGNYLDTTADKLLVAGALFALVAVDRCSPWLAALIVGREVMILGLRGAVSASDGTVVTPSWMGKAKANAQFVAITLAIWRPEVVLGGRYLDAWAMLVAAVVTVASAGDYLRRFVGRLSRHR